MKFGKKKWMSLSNNSVYLSGWVVRLLLPFLVFVDWSIGGRCCGVCVCDCEVVVFRNDKRAEKTKNRSSSSVENWFVCLVVVVVVVSCSSSSVVVVEIEKKTNKTGWLVSRQKSKSNGNWFCSCSFTRSRVQNSSSWERPWQKIIRPLQSEVRRRFNNNTVLFLLRLHATSIEKKGRRRMAS